MSSRHEFKYILTEQQSSAIENFLQKKVCIPRDLHSEGKYLVTSLYYDTPQLNDFYDKLGGYKNRKKLRARTYGQDFSDSPEVINLEIKEKHDMNVWKKQTRVRAKKSDLIESIEEIFKSTEHNEQLREFKYLYYLQGSYPHIIVRYKRNAYEQFFTSKVRVTFDRNIETCYASSDMTYSPMYPVTDKVIMEIKFTGILPWWFGYIVRNFELSRKPFSKYSESVDTLTKLNPIPR